MFEAKQVTQNTTKTRNGLYRVFELSQEKLETDVI